MKTLIKNMKNTPKLIHLQTTEMCSASCQGNILFSLSTKITKTKTKKKKKKKKIIYIFKTSKSNKISNTQHNY